MTETTYSAAWVPNDDPARTLDVAAELAAAWVLRQAETLGTKPVLATPTQAEWSAGPDIIRSLSKSWDTTTERGTAPSEQQRAVLAYVPTYRGLYRLLPCVRDGALAVVELSPYFLSGWAMDSRAVNLVNGQTTPEAWTPAQRTLLEDIDRYGNNGWAPGFDAEGAARLLPQLIADGVDQNVILGFMVARGHDETSVERLASIIGRLA
ncbi:hypothetical protein [Streptomyces hydrogenans]|uniref:hypothetical protein n=1 Tax=Streptomyces hydrogenans TaxID=1873719 RepID=UPI003681CA96